MPEIQHENTLKRSLHILAVYVLMSLKWSEMKREGKNIQLKKKDVQNPSIIHRDNAF